jgi:uncharacterized membrane protein YhaH (DUF805 family)
MIIFNWGIPMNFTEAVTTVITKKYADFDGRAARSEFWWFVLFNFIVSAVLGLIDNMVFGMPALQVLFALALLIPGLAVSVRRLHDKGKSGWWIFIALVPIVGPILLIYWYATAGEPQDNAYGAPVA